MTVDNARVDPPNDVEPCRAFRRYRNAVLREFIPSIHGSLLAVGDRIGEFLRRLDEVRKLDRITCVEPMTYRAEVLRSRFPGVEIWSGAVRDVQMPGGCDSILSIHSLECVADDDSELKRYAEILEPTRGTLCLIVSAGPRIYAPLDRDSGRLRRYANAVLRRKLEAARFEVRRLHYLNFPGYFSWWRHFKVRGLREFNLGQFYGSSGSIFPISNLVERSLCRPPIGLDLVAVARSG